MSFALRRWKPRFSWLVFLPLLVSGCARSREKALTVHVGSKAFTESVILGDIVRYLAASTGGKVEHHARLGDTSKTWNGLLAGDLDVYVEYTGTLTQEILLDEHLRSDEALRQSLANRGLRMSRSLGFSNNYALGMKEGRANTLGIKTISNLRGHPDLILGLSHPFIKRGDGWEALKRAYKLPFRTPQGMEHKLAYLGVEAGALDVIDLYTTDAEIKQFGLRVLEDDRHFFPAYDAVLLYRDDLEERAPDVVKALLRLEGAISAETMREMNARVIVDKVSEAEVAGDFLADKLHVHAEIHIETAAQRIWKATLEHLWLVAVSLLAAIVTAIPLGIVAARKPVLGQALLALVSVIQTFPALALLSVLLVFLGIGPKPAIAALYIYSLLPIVRNTFTGLRDIPLNIRESAEALGLSSFARLELIELPMASRAILAGVKTAAVINVGFATLGGLIGAGGYGSAIIAGLDKNDYALLMEGAIPAAVMALVVQGMFEGVERFLVPRGLRLKPAE